MTKTASGLSPRSLQHRDGRNGKVEKSVALAIPDPRTTPVPFGWCEAIAEPALESADDWNALDEAEAALAAYVSWLESHGVDTTEFLKAMRLVEKRRADLLGDRHQGKQLLSRVEEVNASEPTIVRWRKLRDNWEWLRPLVMQATRPAEVSQSRLLKLIKQRHGFNGDSPVPEGVYRTIVADPPWRYDNRGTRGAAEDHYSTMTVDDICELAEKVPADDNAHLYLWTTNAFLRPAFDVVEAWGFEYKTCLTWVKPQIGLGNYFRNSTEHVLFGLRGELDTRADDVPTWFNAKRGKHSAKPDLFLDLVERCSPGPYLEMFARRRRMGWEVWGLEA